MIELARIPKAELHCHIDGLLDAAFVRELAAAGHVMGVSPDQLAEHCPVTSLEHWLTDYAPIADRACEPKDVWLPIVLEHHVGRLRDQGATYAEVFVSSLLGTREDHGELVDLFRILRDRVDAAAGDDLEVALVVCIGRGSPERLARQAPKILALRRAGSICGVALAGDEAGHPVQPLATHFDSFREAGLGIEIHAGEFCGPESVRDALDYGRPDRIGHGVRAFEDPRLVDTIATRNVHLEFCPTSNLRLGVIERIEDHPVARAWEHGVSFSINTDDPGPFGCSLESELALVSQVFGYGEPELSRIYRETLAAGFGGR